MYFSSFVTTLQHTGNVTMRLLQQSDMPIICQWLTLPYAHFWGMSKHTPEQMCSAYQDIINNPHHLSLIHI